MAQGNVVYQEVLRGFRITGNIMFAKAPVVLLVRGVILSTMVWKVTHFLVLNSLATVARSGVVTSA